MIDHLKLFVADPAASRAFYEAALEPLGYRVMLEPAPGVVGMGADRPDFWLAPPTARRRSRHVAFRADSEQEVQRFHAAALAAGAHRQRRSPARGRTTTRTTTAPSRSTPTATTSRPSTTARCSPRPTPPWRRRRLDRDDAQALAGRAREARRAGHDALDVVALEHLVLEQLAGELVELVAVLEDQLRGAAHRLVGQVLLLLVAQLARAVGDEAALVRDAARGDRGAHRVVVDHRARDLRDAQEVVGGAGGDRAEHDLLRRAAAEQHGHVVDQLLAGLEVAVLLREVERVAQRAPARHDRDLVHAVDARQQLGAQRVARLVEGDDAALVVVERAARLHAGHDALERGVEVGVRDELAVLAGREDRRLVAEVREVGAGEARRLAGDHREVDVAERLAARVHLHDLLAAGHVGRRDEDLAVEAARAQQRRSRASRAGWRRR